MSPSLQLEIRKSGPSSGTVILANRGSSTLRVWRSGNSWGDDTLFFEIVSNGRASEIRRTPQTYTRNLPASVALEPGGAQEFPFDMGDGEWEPEAAVQRATAPEARITAIYRVAASPEATAQGVWVGEVRSGPVSLR